MKFLLVNTNAAVKKIFSIAARKANISLDFINSLNEISIQEDYDCIFIDDGVLNTGNFEDIKSKMIDTKFCLIISKDSTIIAGFDNYIRKPFLPTDIYEVLKQEKRSDMNFSSFESDNNLTFDANKNLDNKIKNIDLLDEMDNHNMNVNVNINNIDLSEFDDNDDEFLSGMKDSNMPALNPQNSEETMIRNNNLNDNDEIKFTYDNDLDMNNNSNNNLDTIDLKDSKNTSNVSINNNISNNNFNKQNDILPDIITDNKINNTNTNYTSNNSDEIDFSSIFAMQDEFLKSQNKDRPKGIIGGDIYVKKENANQKDDTSMIEENQVDTSTIGRMKVNISQEPIGDDSNQVSDVSSFDELDSLNDDDFDDLNLADEYFKVDKKDMLENNYQENLSNDFNNDDFNNNNDFTNDDFDNDDFNINKLSDEDWDNLDDEALLKLQEETPAFDEPKILNKNDIDEVTNILEDTQNLGNNLNSNDVKIASNGLDSITQEAFSEAIDETNRNDNFNFDDNLPSVDNIIEPIEEQIIPSQVNNAQELNDNTNNNTSNTSSNNVTQNMMSNANIDLTEIVKSFPVDKLRELLSGVQITINITFPTKK